ncbi:MAG: Ig-like domain-containing protein [Thermoleophilia bacterium]
MIKFAGIIWLMFLLATAGCGNTTSGELATTATATQTQKMALEISTPSNKIYNTPSISIEGKTEPGAKVTVLGGLKSASAKADANGKFGVTVDLAEGKNSLSAEASNGSAHSSQDTLIATYQVDETTYKAQCQNIDFKILNKNPDSYKGTKYYTMGHVAQIQESGGNSMLRVDVTDSGYGFWTDTIWVEFPGKTPAVQDSIVNVWGDVYGSYTYKSQAGWDIALPAVQARYVEVVTQ